MVTPAVHPVTINQLACMFEAAGRANSELSAAHRSKPRDPGVIEILRQRSREMNRAYDAARRRYKQQQKADQA